LADLRRSDGGRGAGRGRPGLGQPGPGGAGSGSAGLVRHGAGSLWGHFVVAPSSARASGLGRLGLKPGRRRPDQGRVSLAGDPSGGKKRLFPGAGRPDRGAAFPLAGTPAGGGFLGGWGGVG